MKKLGVISLVVALILALCAVPVIQVGASPDSAIAGLWHLDDDASDSSGNGNNGSTVGNATFVDPGYFGEGAVLLDGDGDYVTVPDSTSLDISNFITVEAWIKINSYDSGKVYTIAGKWNDIGVNKRGYLLALSTKETGHPLAKFYISTDGINFASAVAPETLSVDTWYHLVGTYNGSLITIGFDEMEKGSYSLSAAINTNDEPLLIGGNKAGGSGGNGYFDGLIEEVRIWNSVPIDFEVSATPVAAYNPITVDEHSVVATVDPVAPGVVVHLEVIDGPNVGATDNDSDQTDNNSQVTLTYDSNGTAGLDTIRVWVDLNWNGSYDEGIDNFTIVTKAWLENFVTGGASIKCNNDALDGLGLPNNNKPAFTFAGTVGCLPDLGIVGQFQIVIHPELAKIIDPDINGSISIHLNSFTHLEFDGPATESPPATHKQATFTGTGFSNKVDPVGEVTIIITDNAEPGKGFDTIEIVGLGVGSIVIDGGNFQIHNIE